LIGVDLALEDRHRTPFAALERDDGGTLPGVFIHAYTLAQLLDGDLERRPLPWAIVLLTFTFAVLGAVCGQRAKSASRFALAQAFGISGLLISGFALSSVGGPVPALLTPLFAFVVASGCMMIRRWYAAHHQARFLRNAFSRYVAPAIVEQLVAHPKTLRLSGERRELTFLFTDIAGFTTLTESMPAEPLVTILNEYIDGVSQIVAEYEGTIDKIVGDALHVMFNAPVDQADHAARAVRCALAIDPYCDDFEQRMQAREIRFGMTRIGVNTGSTVVGNMGGNTRFDYTATGDAINVAARLESANRHLGTRVCVGARTRELCQDVAFRPIGELVLKGKTESLEVFEPLSGAGVRAGLGAYLHAFELMKSLHQDALVAFGQLASVCPGDKLVAFHAARLVAGEKGSRVVLGEK
jgi:adenylate cyclase